MTTTGTSNEEHETNFIESVPTSQNQVALCTANTVAVVANSLSSSPSEWSISDEDVAKSVALNGPQFPVRRNERYVLSTLANCNDVNTTTTTHIYEPGVTVNKNFYCCSSSIDHVSKCCVIRYCIASFIFVLIATLITVLFSMLLSNLGVQKQDVTNIVQKDIEIDTNKVVLTTPTAQTTVAALLMLSDPTSSVDISTHAYNDSDTESTIFLTPPIITVAPPTKLSTTAYQNVSGFNVTVYHGWKIIRRNEWGAEKTRYVPEKLPHLPPTYVIFSETGTDTCTTTQKCMETVNNIQVSDLKYYAKGDIVYNFLIGGDGMVYEGRGWDVQAGVGNYGTEYFDNISISVSFIGTFDVDVPTKVILQTAKTLLEFGVQTKKLAEEYKLMGLRQLSTPLTETSSNPGDELYNVIKTWKRWDSRTIEAFPTIDPAFLGFY